MMRSPLASSARYSTNTLPPFTTAAGLNVACSSHRTMLSPRGERNWDAGLGVMAGFTSRGFSNGPNIHVRPCPHAGCPVREPGADRSTTRTRAFSGRRLPSLSPSQRAFAPWLDPRLLARRAAGPLPAAAAPRAWRPPAAARGPAEHGRDRAPPLARQPVDARQLVDVGPGHHEARGPHQLLLILGVQVVEMNQFRGVELVLGNERAGLELEDVESARNFGAHDVAVVPIRGPRPGADQLGRVHRATVEKGDLPWVRRIGPIEHRDAALIPRLDHDVAARDRDQRAVVGDAVLVGGLRRRELVIALE